MRKLLSVLLVALLLVGCGEEAKDDPRDAEAQTFMERLAEVQFNLGEAEMKGAYLYPWGDSRNVDFSRRAEKWFRLAAEQGHTEAQVELANMYYTGHGLPKDYVAGYAWSNIAVLGGLEYGARYLADLREGRSSVRGGLTPEQIAEAQELSKELLKKIEAKKKGEQIPFPWTSN